MNGERERFRRTLEEIASGSEEAVERFIAVYGPHIRRAVRRRLSDHMRSKFDSIDFEQMVWASVFRQPQRLDVAQTPGQLSIS